MTNFSLPDNERQYLRSLAARQAEIAALPVMQERRKMWYDLNDGVPGARPPVIVETWTFDRDFLPGEVFKCESGFGRGIEYQLLRNIRNHELINDDKVIPDTFDMGWSVSIDEMGVSIGRETAVDAQGYRTGFHYLHPIKDLKRDLGMLKPAQCSVNREDTEERRQFLAELLGEFLPVAVRTGVYGNGMLTHRVVELMGMEAFFIAMYDSPDELHQLMAYLRDNGLRVMRWAESEGLLRLNNENQDSFGSSYNFTTRLPARNVNGGKVELRDMWGAANSQETVGVSPAMFHEFCAPYYHAIAEPVGLLYFGCCEPVHPFWEDIKTFPHLKKVSISRWCDEAFMGKALQGTGVVYSRKPDPKFLGVDVQLDEEGWAAHVRHTLEATEGVPVEFICRDVYTVHGDLSKPRRAVEIAHREIDQARG